MQRGTYETIHTMHSIQHLVSNYQFTEFFKKLMFYHIHIEVKPTNTTVSAPDFSSKQPAP